MALGFMTAADLRKANLTGVSAVRTNFSSSNLQEAKVIKATIIECFFINTDLNGTTFKDSDLAFSDFSNSKLKLTNFTGANLKSTIFH